MHKIVYKSQCVFRTRFLILNFIMEPLIYAHEFARYGLKSYLLIATSNARNTNYDYTIMKRKDGHLRSSVTVPFEVMTIMLTRIDRAIDLLDQEREWLTQMSFGPSVGKYYQLFCTTVYLNASQLWGVSASLRTSDRRIYIGLHEMAAHSTTQPKAVYLHFAALRALTASLDNAIFEVAHHMNESQVTYEPIDGNAVYPIIFEQRVRAALAHDS